MLRCCDEMGWWTADFFARPNNRILYLSLWNLQQTISRQRSRWPQAPEVSLTGYVTDSLSFLCGRRRVYAEQPLDARETRASLEFETPGIQSAIRVRRRGYIKEAADILTVWFKMKPGGLLPMMPVDEYLKRLNTVRRD